MEHFFPNELCNLVREFQYGDPKIEKSKFVHQIKMLRVIVEFCLRIGYLEQENLDYYGVTPKDFDDEGDYEYCLTSLKFMDMPGRLWFSYTQKEIKCICGATFRRCDSHRHISTSLHIFKVRSIIRDIRIQILQKRLGL